MRLSHYQVDFSVAYHYNYTRQSEAYYEKRRLRTVTVLILLYGASSQLLVHTILAPFPQQGGYLQPVTENPYQAYVQYHFQFRIDFLVHVGPGYEYVPIYRDGSHAEQGDAHATVP